MSLLLLNKRRAFTPGDLISTWDELPLDEGSGQTLTNIGNNNSGNGVLGEDSGASTDDPTWESTGLSFDGGDHCNLDALGALYNHADNDFFVMLLVNGSVGGAAFGESYGPDFDEFAILSATTGLLRIVRRNSGTPANSAFAGSTAWDDTWRTIAHADLAGTQKTWVDAVAGATDSYTAGGVNRFNAVRLGGRLSSSAMGSSYTGKIAYVIRMARGAITNDEVVSLHNYISRQVAARGITLATV